MSQWCVEVTEISHKTFPLKILESIFDIMKSYPSHNLSQVTHSINQSFFLNKFHQIDDFQKKAFQNIDHSFSIQFTEKSEFVFYSKEHHESKLNSMKNRAKAPTNKSLSIFSFKFSPISFFSVNLFQITKRPVGSIVSVNFSVIFGLKMREMGRLRGVFSSLDFFGFFKSI